MSEFSIPKERVPKQLYSTYDFCAKGGDDDTKLDTIDEISKFFHSAELTLKNRRISGDEYDSFINEFKAEKEQSDAYERQKFKQWQAEKKEIIKKKIAQLEEDIKKFEDYQKENPTTSTVNSVLNTAEKVSKAGIMFATLVATIYIPDGGAICRAVGDWAIESSSNGAIESSTYNQLRKKADYKKLKYLKSVINNPYPPMMALINAAK